MLEGDRDFPGEKTFQCPECRSDVYEWDFDVNLGACKFCIIRRPNPKKIISPEKKRYFKEYAESNKERIRFVHKRYYSRPDIKAKRLNYYHGEKWVAYHQVYNKLHPKKKKEVII